MTRITFIVHGIPRPGGSKTPRTNRKTGAMYVQEAGKHTPAWRSDVKDAAYAAMRGQSLLDGPLSLFVRFVFPRPKSHYRTGKRAHELRDDAPYYHTSAPDTTKLLRSLEDAIKGIAWVDDSRVAVQQATKVYGDKPGALVEIETIESKGLVARAI